MFWKLIYLTLIPLHNRGRWSVNVLNFFLMALIATSIICSGSNWNGWRMVEWKFSLSHVFSSEQSLSQRAIHDITSIRQDQILTNFYVISTYFFDVISMVEKSMLFPHSFFDVISMVEKSTFFPCTFFNVISMVEKSTFFPCTFFNVISMVAKSTSFPRTFFDVISLVEISTVFLLTFFDVILMLKKSSLSASTFFYEISMGKNSTSFLVICKLMKTFEGFFLC